MKIVRTLSSAKGGITAAERAAMKIHTDMWVARAMRTEPIEPEKIASAIKALYAAAGLKEPRVVVAPSPLAMAFAYGAAAAIWHCRRDATRAATYAATYAATRAATYAATRAATYDATYDATRDATDDATRAATRDATYDATYAATDACFDIAGNLGLACAKRWSIAYQGGNMWAPWECYLTAARDILGLKLPQHESYAAWEQAAIHGGFRVMHPEFCIVSDFPEVLRVDEQNRPHCAYGPSHRWRDGWSLYFWHGTRIPDEWITHPETLTPQIALTWENIEQRRAALEILGWAKVLRELRSRVIDDHPDPETGALVEVDLPADNGRTIRARFLHVLCGTRREFALGVPVDIETSEAAQAWLFGEAAYQKPEIRT